MKKEKKKEFFRVSYVVISSALVIWIYNNPSDSGRKLNLHTSYVRSIYVLCLRESQRIRYLTNKNLNNWSDISQIYVCREEFKFKDDKFECHINI